MEHRKTQIELFATPADEKRAQEIVDKMVGVGFYVDIVSWPKNVGIKGDEGVLGHTALISSDLANPSPFLAQHYELLAEVSIRICNEIESVCRVLFDITIVDSPNL
jgi:GMP synthase PP-ATPase subunit